MTTASPPSAQVEETLPSDPAHTTEHGAETAAEHGGGGLPQFEAQHYAGQIGYLLILFAILYILIAKVFAPRMRRVFDERADTIATAVATARQVQAEAAGEADRAKAEVAEARAASRATAAAARARVTEEAARRAAEEEATVNARIAEAEAGIGRTRDAAMANVGVIASDTAAAMVERLTGQTPTSEELTAARAGAA